MLIVSFAATVASIVLAGLPASVLAQESGAEDPVSLGAADAAAMSQDPKVQAALTGMKAARPVADLADSSSQARLERRRSRTAYADLADASALETLRSLFPELLTKPLWSPPQLADGERITAWKDTNTATITGPDGLEATLHSATPIRSSVATGEAKLADISLSQGASGYVPANPLTPYELSAVANQPFRFDEGGIGVRFVDAAPAAPQRTEAKLAYPNAWKDTDLVVAPLPEGFSTTQVLRSADSPERYQIALDLPTGAALEEYHQGGMAFAGVQLPDGRGGLRITAPRAIDADGTAIDTSLRVTGPNTLEVSIAHRAKDLRYPLQLDPFYLFCNSGCGDYWNEWTYYNPDVPLSGL